MYRRLKNLLGVSLIILAIVLSQMPMEAVQADTTQTEEEQVAENEPVSSASGNEQDGENGLTTVIEQDASQQVSSEQDASQQVSADQNASQQVSTDQDILQGNQTETEDSIVESPVTLLSDEQVQQVQGAEDISASLFSANNARAAGDVTVTFHYGFSSLNPTTSSVKIQAGNVIDLSATPLKIDTDDKTGELLTEGSQYKIGGITYKFWGWFRDTSGSGKWDFTNNTVTTDMTLYASWSSIDDRIFTITYSASDADSASDQIQKVTAKAGAAIPQAPRVPIRSEYTFDYWEDTNHVQVDWTMAVNQDMTFYAVWKQKEYTVTFDANGAAYTPGSNTLSVQVPTGQSLAQNQYPDGTFAYDSCETDDKWYTDKTCLSVYDTSSVVTSDITLFKKWTRKTEEGFTLSVDGTVLYNFDGDQEEVVIPATVTTIATDAFSDMRNIKRITLPARLGDIKENAFSGMTASSFLTRDIYIYSSKEGAYDSKLIGKNLADRYEHFIYVTSSDGGESSSSSTSELQDINCSLVDVDRAVDASGNPVYPKVTLPYDLPNGRYQLVLTEDGIQVHIADLLKAAGHNLSDGYVYYMDISLKKIGETDSYKPTWTNGTMAITMPLPTSWQGRDQSKIKMYTVSQDYTKLEEVSICNFSSNIFTFKPAHFSEFALVYSGTINNSSSENGGTTDPGNGGGSDNGGSSSSGGSSGGSSSSGGGTGSTQTSTGNTTPPGTQTTVPIDTTSPNTQPVITTPVNANNGGQAAHVKDSTPKTGDPLEYRTLLVCSLFSIGVLLLLIGNKKKTSASSRYLRV